MYRNVFNSDFQSGTLKRQSALVLAVFIYSEKTWLRAFVVWKCISKVELPFRVLSHNSDNFSRFCLWSISWNFHHSHICNVYTQLFPSIKIDSVLVFVILISALRPWNMKNIRTIIYILCVLPRCAFWKMAISLFQSAAHYANALVIGEPSTMETLYI